MTSKNLTIYHSSRNLPGSPSQPNSGVNDYLIDAHEWILPTTATENPDAKIALSSPDSAGCVEIIQISCRLDPPLTDAEALACGLTVKVEPAPPNEDSDDQNLIP